MLRGGGGGDEGVKQKKRGSSRDGRGFIEGINLHGSIRPLHLLDYVQAAVRDERVHVPGFVAEAGDAVAALLRGAEFVLEERVVFRADYAEVVGHFWFCSFRVIDVGQGVEGQR